MFKEKMKTNQHLIVGASIVGITFYIIKLIADYMNTQLEITRIQCVCGPLAPDYKSFLILIAVSLIIALLTFAVVTTGVISHSTEKNK